MNQPSKDKKQPAAAKGEAGGDGIDWANVAREAQTMVELNRSATEAWQEDREDACLGAAALEAHRRSGEATIPLDQVMRNLNAREDG